MRVSREFWLDNEGVVVKATGYSCAPENAGYWWFPMLGYSTRAVFGTEEEAIEAARKSCLDTIESEKKKLEGLGR